MHELRRFSAALLCASALAYTGRAGAQTAPIELKWSALEGCPSADTVLGRVRKIAGATRVTPHTLRADAIVSQPSDSLFRLRLEIHYGDLAAVRNIEGKSCKDLAGAAAVALALLLSSEEPLSERDLAGGSAVTTGPGAPSAAGAGGATAGNQQPENKTSAHGQPAASPSSTQPTASTPPSRVESGPPRRWHVLLAAPLGSLSVGPMSQVSRGLGGGVGFSFDRWRFFAEGRLWAAQHQTTSRMGYEYDVKLERFTATARGCRVFIGARFELAPCALIAVHHLSASGSGHNLVPESDAATWAGVGVGARSRFLVTSWFGLVATLDGELEFSRPEVGVALPPDGSQEPTPVPIERLAPVAATLTIGTEWIF